VNRNNFRANEQGGEIKKNENPNARVKKIKALFGVGYNYRFLELDNLQREFYFEMVRREKQAKKEKGSAKND
jgi:hypothetical protein